MGRDYALLHTRVPVHNAVRIMVVKEQPVGRILLVDDDKMGRCYVRAQLESAGHRVVEAREGLDCLRKLRAEPADLVVTDLVMPVMDGLELINEIRREFPSIPV